MNLVKFGLCLYSLPTAASLTTDLLCVGVTARREVQKLAVQILESGDRLIRSTSKVCNTSQGSLLTVASNCLE